MSTAAARPGSSPGPRSRTVGTATANRRELVSMYDQPGAATAFGDFVGPGRPDALPTAWPSRLRVPVEPPCPQPEAVRCGSMVGASRPMREIFDQIARVAPTDASVLILGESGTGKELVAEAVHALSRRTSRPMISINCGAFPATLIESELFGHERGSFTGAARLHRGHFERADGGTLFLDEVNEMPFELQVKLLRVLESGTFFRVGGDRPVTAGVRIVAASKPHLERAAAEGRFRADLLYRLRVIPIYLPPLRERSGDLALLAEHFLDDLNCRTGIGKRLAPAALALLQAHDWPGNVRELKHLLERAFILSDDEIGPAEVSGLSSRWDGAPPVQAPPRGAVLLEPGISLDDAERRFVLATLASTGGDRARTAAMLGISARALRRRLLGYRSRGDSAAETRVPSDSAT